MKPAQHNIQGTWFYLQIYALLLALLVATVAAARLEMGRWNTIVALLIAAIKAVLVILFFMHLWKGAHLTWIFAAAAFLWLGLLLALTMTDYSGRDHVAPDSLAHITAPTAASNSP